MENENENLDSSNEEDKNTDFENGENQEWNEPDLDALKKDKDILSDKNKKLFERAKKSETEVKELREQLKKLSGDKPEDKSLDKSQPNEPDYARLAFLEQRGLTHPDDQKLVQDEANRLKMPLTDILNMDHIKSQLETAKDQREVKAGMPKGGGRAGSGATQQDVDYWLAKGETPDD